MLKIYVAKNKKGKKITQEGFTKAQAKQIRDIDNYHTCIVGKVGSGKTSLLKHIVDTYRDNMHTNTPIFYQNPGNSKSIWSDLLNLKPTDVKEFIDNIASIKKEMQERLHIIESIPINSYIKTYCIGPKYVFIDDLDRYFYLAKAISQEDYDKLYSDFMSIIRLGRPAGIYIYYTCQSLIGGDITKDMNDNMYRNRFIFLGNIDEKEYKDIDDKIISSEQRDLIQKYNQEAITIVAYSKSNTFKRLVL